MTKPKYPLLALGAHVRCATRLVRDDISSEKPPGARRIDHLYWQTVWQTVRADAEIVGVLVGYRGHGKHDPVGT